MISASVTRAEYLKRAELLAVASDAVVLARWGDDAGDTSQSSVLVDDAAALEEAERQLAQLAQPGAIDVAIVPGCWPDLEGATIELPYDGQFGLAGTQEMLVLRSRVLLSSGETELEGWVLL